MTEVRQMTDKLYRLNRSLRVTGGAMGWDTSGTLLPGTFIKGIQEVDGFYKFVTAERKDSELWLRYFSSDKPSVVEYKPPKAKR